MLEVRRLLPDLVGEDCVTDVAATGDDQDAASDTRIRCLIVDDDRVCRELLRDMIEPIANCDFAYDGSEAVDVVRLAIEDGAPYDLICLDIMMPGMDGHEALSAIRGLESKHGIRGSDGVKIVMTTALRDSQHCIQSFQEGCECYVTKPVDHDQFFERLRSLRLIPAEETATTDS
jgi:two-component system chemotaxis response regulator CheY